MRRVNEGIRIATMALDHVFMTFIAMIFFLPGLVTTMVSAFSAGHGQPVASPFDGPWKYVGLFGFALYFCKDSINGRSLAKRILKLQVVDYETGKAASPLQCFVRNIFCIIWFVEIFVALANTERRIGDKVAGTKLVYYDAGLPQPKFNFLKAFASLLLAYGIMFLFTMLTPSFEMPTPKYSATSYNKTASIELKQLIADSLGQYLAADIRIYDSTAIAGIKYISAIMQLRENYLEEESSYEQLRDMTKEVIYSKYPEESFTGQLRFVYRASGVFRSRQLSIGTYVSD